MLPCFLFLFDTGFIHHIYGQLNTILQHVVFKATKRRKIKDNFENKFYSDLFTIGGRKFCRKNDTETSPRRQGAATPQIPNQHQQFVIGSKAPLLTAASQLTALAAAPDDDTGNVDNQPSLPQKVHYRQASPRHPASLDNSPPQR